MTTRRSILLLSGALAISACQPKPIDVDFDGSADNVEISAFSGGVLGFFRSPASISGVTIWPKDSDDIAWRIHSMGSCRTSVHQVRYGVVPEGFEQLIAPEPLREGVDYSVWIDGCSERHGGGYFAIRDGRVATVAFVTLERR